MTVLLLTGRPGVGKTTVIREVAEGLPRERLGGFYTEEVREHGRRRGFRAVTYDGWARVIADRDLPGPARVGRYGVDVAAIDALLVWPTGRPASRVPLLATAGRASRISGPLLGRIDTR